MDKGKEGKKTRQKAGIGTKARPDGGYVKNRKLSAQLIMPLVSNSHFGVEAVIPAWTAGIHLLLYERGDIKQATVYLDRISDASHRHRGMRPHQVGNCLHCDFSGDYFSQFLLFCLAYAIPTPANAPLPLS